MKTRTSLLLVATTMALAGCAVIDMMRAKTLPSPDFICLKGGPCTITVTVASCTAGGVKVDYDTVWLKRGYPNLPIKWELNTTVPDLTFEQDGIVFKPSSPQFIRLMPTANGKQYMAVGLNTDAKTVHKYDIRVMKNRTTECSRLDPTVVNE